MAVNIYVHWKIPVNTECGGGGKDKYEEWIGAELSA